MECTGERYLPDFDGNWTLEHMHRYLIAREFSHEKDVLDIASGEGYGSYMLSSVAKNVIGIDISEEAISFASKKYKRENLKFIKGEVYDIPLKDNSIDIVVSFETIEHVNNHDMMMKEIKRVLKKDGLLVISSPDKNEYSDIPGYHNPYHVHELYRKEFEQLLSSYFKYYDVAGQRVIFGSVIGGEEGDKFLSWEKNNYDISTKGLLGAEYCVAVASDDRKETLPSGVLKCPVENSDHAKNLEKLIDQLRTECDARMRRTKEIEKICEDLKTECNTLHFELENIKKTRMYKFSQSIKKRRTFIKKTINKFYSHIHSFIKYNNELNNYNIKAIAFYLPQFHTFKENDLWWGEGFTEWTNVKRAYPLFSGHVQPEVPHESVGYYNLLNTEVMRNQARIATQYGIYGFCFHHYWFSGKRLMEKPVDMFLNDPSINIHFCLNWANENWTRRWDGMEQDVLIAQNYAPEDDIAFMLDLLKYFKDPRYIRIDGRPLFLLYRADLLPDMSATLKRWKKVCVEHGENAPYVVMCQSFGNFDPRPYGFDGAVQFPPHFPWDIKGVGNTPKNVPGLKSDFSGSIFDYNKMAQSCLEGLSDEFFQIPCVAPAWDNTPRRLNHASVFAGSSPAQYKKWLIEACRFIGRHAPEDRRFVFINAWNEWGEGAHLEPSAATGFSYLNATLDVVSDRSPFHFDICDDGVCWKLLKGKKPQRITEVFRAAIHIHLYYVDLLDEFISFLKRMEIPFDLYISVPEHVNTEEVYQKFSAALSLAGKVTVAHVPNRGADVAPFLCTFGKFLINYDLIGHIHSKKSLSWNIKNGEEWRIYLLNHLFPDNIRTLNMLYAFLLNNNVKLIYPDHFSKIKKHLLWSINYRRAEELSRKIEIELPKESSDYIDFPSGFMFWCKSDVLKKLMALELSIDDFEEITGTDGSTAHALERLLGFIVKSSEKRHIVLDDVD